jgi:hypothetical protein
MRTISAFLAILLLGFVAAQHLLYEPGSEYKYSYDTQTLTFDERNSRQTSGVQYNVGF